MTDNVLTEARANTDAALTELEDFKARAARVDRLGRFTMRTICGSIAAFFFVLGVYGATFGQGHIYARDRVQFFTLDILMFLLMGMFAAGTFQAVGRVYSSIGKAIFNAFNRVPDKWLPWLGILVGVLIIVLISLVAWL